MKTLYILAAAFGMICGAATAAAENAGPAARAHHSAVFDSATGELVVYGGYIYDPTSAKHNRAVGDLWAWNGKSWRFIGDSGEARIVPSMAYDSRRNRIVMFGGFSETKDGNDDSDGQLSVLADNHWQVVKNENDLARGGGAMAYDAARDRLVLFGGRRGQVELADTWEFGGDAWTPTWVAGPSLRDPTAMAYDSDRGVTVLYGGFRPLAGLGDTWEWDGKAWTEVTDRGPGPRAWPGLAYDALRHRIVLFSGEDEAGKFLGDTWVYDGKAWAKIATQGPPARIQFVMAYDKARDRVVIFGGMSAEGHYLDDVWEFDGTHWQKRYPLP